MNTTNRDARFRVNYGNGQVHYAGCRTECEAHIAGLEDYREFAFLQIKVDGDWFKAKPR